jgi:outer membrane receptor protein involved in Fe transport
MRNIKRAKRCALASVFVFGSANALAVGVSAGEAASSLVGTDAPMADEAAPSSVGPARTEGLAEIVVTAQKRSESINKVGLAITALSGDTLKDLNIHSVQDLTQVVPGLTYAASLLDTPVYSLRGVGFYETTLAAYPDVSVYVDQVPLAFPVLTANVALDLERVEVLKGPQGILFGQNSTGGAINYIAAKPTSTLTGGLDLGVGRFDEARFEGYLSGPLTDTLGFRLAFMSEQAGPWQQTYNAPTPAKNGAVSKYAGRLLLDWSPVERLNFELNLNGGFDQSEPVAPQLIDVVLQAPDSVFNGPALLAYPRAPDDARFADFSIRNKPRSNNTQYQASLRGEYEPVNDLTITSITSFVRYERDENVEFGGVSLNTPIGTDFGDEELRLDFGKVTSFFQELRVANSTSDPVRWLAGLNYDHSNVYEFNLYDYSGSSEADSPGVAASLGRNLTNTPFYSDQTMNNYAAFGNIDWDITHLFTFKAGVRYTESDRHAKLCTQGGYGGGVDQAFDHLMSLLHGGLVFPPLTAEDCVTLDPTTLLSVREGFIGDLNEHNVSWRGGVDYKATPNALLYFNATKGYKAGSFPMLSASTSYQYLPVKQESVLDYEGGFKIGLFDRTVQLNGAGFHYDYTNKQIRTQTVQPIFGILNNLQNVPKSTVDGGELQLAWAATRGLRLAAAVTYLRAKVTEFVGTNGAGIRQDYAGTEVPYSPKFSSNATGDYQWDLSANWVASVGATITQRSVSYATVGPTPDDRIAPYVLLDLRAGLATQDGRYRVQLWGRNVTNRFYWNNVSHPYDTIVRYAGMPVTYGVTFSAHFQ